MVRALLRAFLHTNHVTSVIQDLGEPNGLNRHDLFRQASSYEGHEPSSLDTQAKTIRAGVHGPGGGNSTIPRSFTMLLFVY